MVSTPARPRLRFNLGWGAAIALLGFAFAWLSAATALRIVFGLLLAALGLPFAWRALRNVRERLLWRLQWRLLATYVFVGVIPIVLLAAMAAVASWIIYGKVAVYLVTDEFYAIQSDLSGAAAEAAAELALEAASGPAVHLEKLRAVAGRHLEGVRQRYPAAELHLLGGPFPPQEAAPAWLANRRFDGVVMGEPPEIIASHAFSAGKQQATLALRLPLDTATVALLGEPFARVSLFLVEPARPGAARRPTLTLGGETYSVLEAISDERPLPPPAAWWDFAFTFLASRPTHDRASGEVGPPLVVSVESRLIRIHGRLTPRLGVFSTLPATIFVFFAGLFLLLEAAALVIGVRLSRTITATVNNLQTATERVQAGDFSHRIRLQGRDQLSGLAHAFNSMSASIEGLIEESKARQRLENELEIARQVQEQLFPREAPRLRTLELVARCLPARTVSGDYFDYGLAAPGRLLLTIGDISGKGISAALLMASIQAILRSQVYASRLQGLLDQLTMAELMARVNRQLSASTGGEKFASLFLASYDDAARRLTYTNAGHPPPVIVRRAGLEPLTAGGPVAGLFADAVYEQGSATLEPGDLFVAFTDGITEAENSYEEQFGEERLHRLFRENADGATPQRLIERVLTELQQWAPGQEPSDDRTLLVARVL